MTDYDTFARFYDRLMGEVDYGARAGYLRRLFERHGLNPALMLDLGCGTGSLTVELAKAGYDMIGADRSEQMLSAAAEKAGESGQNVLFLCQDMRALDLYGTVDAAVSSLDCLNHLPSSVAVAQALERVSLFLNPGGLFVFDLNTPYKLETVIGDHTFVYDEPGVFCVWQNSYSRQRKTCRFDLTFFEAAGETYRRYEEHFSERAYSGGKVRTLLSQAGLELIAEYDDMTFDGPSEHTERIVYVARKELKE